MPRHKKLGGLIISGLILSALLLGLGGNARPVTAQVFSTPTPFVAVAPPGPEKPIVHAVMFWMDGCSHCHEVIEQVLPPLQQKYGAQFDLQLIEVVTADDIDRLYQVGAAYGLAKEQVGVPFLIIGDRALVWLIHKLPA
jgi:thiol-disulfide isomerase/thioredoxin